MTPLDSALFGFGIVAIPAYILYSIVARPRRATEKAAELDGVLAELRQQVLVVASSSIPGKEIKRVFGTVTGISQTQAVCKQEFALAEKEAMYQLILEAQKLGANAVIDLKAVMGTYQQQGSQWQVSQTVYNGTAVLI